MVNNANMAQQSRKVGTEALELRTLISLDDFNEGCSNGMMQSEARLGQNNTICNEDSNKRQTFLK